MKLFTTLFFQVKKIIKKIIVTQVDTEEKVINDFFKRGQIPWSKGYEIHKEKSIAKALHNVDIIDSIDKLNQSSNYGYRLDERIVEYPWVFKYLENTGSRLLDAGSTFNFKYILDLPQLQKKELTIFTYAPESPNFNEKKISYVYGDLRELPFKNEYFDAIVSQSTIEHIDMDNSIYGYDIEHNKNSEKKSYEYLLAVKEMVRVLKVDGTLLITFPFGKFEHHGFFQQFNDEMLEILIQELNQNGKCETAFFRYLKQGWCSCLQLDCANIKSYNPHTKKGEAEDGAAHCRSICCINFKKN